MIMLVWTISMQSGILQRDNGNQIVGNPIPPIEQPISIDPGQPGAMLVSDAQPDVLLDHYLTSPHVVQELPPILVGNKFSTQGQEITYMRRIIETRSVSGLYQEVIDEDGNRHLVPRQNRRAEPAEIY